MRLVTFNVLHGEGCADGVVDLDRFAAAITALDPDVLALQEVDRAQPRSHLADLTDVAAQAMRASGSRFVAAMAGEAGRRWRPAPRNPPEGVAAYGVSLVSRCPLLGWRELRLPRIRPPFPFVRRGPRRLELRREERRAAVLARIATPEGSLLVVSTHLSFVPAWGQLQLYAIRRALAPLPGPALIMGDLNMTPPLPRLITGYRPLLSTPTFPVFEPVHQIDHVLARGDVGEVVSAGGRAMPLSDHQAGVVVLDRSRLAPAGSR